ncbi:MAG: flagellar biosynthetic protein FliO [Candidatus Zixiibacteriota bacterium]
MATSRSEHRRKLIAAATVIGVALVGLLLVTIGRNGESRSLYATGDTPVVDSSAASTSTGLVGSAAATISILKMLAALAVVIGCIYLGIYLLKKLMGRRRRGGGAERILEILETAYIDPKKSLSLVRVADKSVLIGVTDNQISVLTELDPEKTQALATANATGQRGSFAGLLRSATDKLKGMSDKGNQLTV